MSDAKESHYPHPAWATPRELAEGEVETILGGNDSRCWDVVDATLAALEEPDRDMINAGIAALDLAMQRQRPIEQRDLVAAIWRAMLREAAK